MNNVNSRLRRARKTRAKIAELKVTRLSVQRGNGHIYAQIIAETGDKVLASASTLEAEVRKSLANGGNVAAVNVLLKKQRPQVSLLLLLIVQVINTTVVLRRWLKPRAKTAYPSNSRG